MASDVKPLTDEMRHAAIRQFEENYIPEPNTGCWLWLGYLVSGYGRMRYGGRTVQAHRFAYEVAAGRSIPTGLQMDHLCRVRCCVNPDHLEPVTQQENIRRGLGPAVLAAVQQRKRDKTHCPQGHPYSGDNLYISRRGDRHCQGVMTASKMLAALIVWAGLSYRSLAPKAPTP